MFGLVPNEGRQNMATATPERLEALKNLGDSDVLYEVIDGRIVQKTVCAYECWLAAVVFGTLDPYLKANPRGRAVQEMIFDLRPVVDRQRRPDLAFVSFERWPRDRGVPETPSLAVAPDLAIEIVSRSNTADEVAEKLEDYFKAGLRLVWVIYPRQWKAYAYASPSEVRVLGLNDELDGTPVLPGFRLALRDLFERAGEPA
jgi:Uma2 family endonuclease